MDPFEPRAGQRRVWARACGEEPAHRRALCAEAHAHQLEQHQRGPPPAHAQGSSVHAHVNVCDACVRHEPVCVADVCDAMVCACLHTHVHACTRTQSDGVYTHMLCDASG
eukprot:9848-Rhodomonas_salina.2